VSAKIKAVGFLIILVAAICFLTALLTPKRFDFGATIPMFRQEANDSIDIAVFGSSPAYCDVIPDMFPERAYVLAGPGQPMSITYYYAREFYRSQDPATIYLEISGMFIGCGEKYADVNIAYMPFGVDRVAAALTLMDRGEWGKLLFPLSWYHTRLSELTQTDYSVALRGYPADENAGHTILSDTNPDALVNSGGGNADEYDKNLAALTDILDLAREHNSKVILFYAPRVDRINPELIAKFVGDISELAQPPFFIDFNTEENFDALGLDSQGDFYDPRHLNQTGAEKFTRALIDVTLGHV